MNLYIVKIDETEYWNERVFKEHPAIKRIFGVYMVDMDSRTYLAEMTPSYFLSFLENQWDGNYRISEEKLEEIDELLRGTEADEDIYMHTGAIDRAPALPGVFGGGSFPKSKMGKKHWHTYTVRDLEEDFDGDRQEAFRDSTEDFFGNPI